MRILIAAFVILSVCIVGCASVPQGTTEEERRLVDEELSKFVFLSRGMTNQELVDGLTFFSRTNRLASSRELLLFRKRNSAVIVELAARGEKARAVLEQHKEDDSRGCLAAPGSSLAVTLPMICRALLSRLDVNTARDDRDKVEKWLDSNKKYISRAAGSGL